LNTNYDSVAEEMGVQPTDDFISGNSDLVKQLKARFKAVINPTSVEDAPLAVQAQAPLSAPGLSVRQIQQRVSPLRCRSRRHRQALARQHRCLAAVDGAPEGASREADKGGQPSQRNRAAGQRP